jgi:hypothetical protein
MDTIRIKCNVAKLLVTEVEVQKVTFPVGSEENKQFWTMYLL